MAQLSICIPTYNRLEFLKWTLRRLHANFPQAEIIVSDNHSDDFVPLHDSWISRYIRQDSNIGPFPNMLAALSAATGDYAVYCADDDYLLPAHVATGIAYLEAHPEVAAYCAPCEIWNERDTYAFWNAFMVPKPLTFDHAHGIDLFNFIIESHVWPEHFIYRTSVPLKPRTRAYWAFADLPDILARGAIHFSPQPFYRNVLVHPVGEREQLGNVQCLTYFDEYRAGLEVLAHGLFGGELRYAARHHISEMIQSFICTRMAVAARLYERSGNPAEAQMLRARLSIASPVRDPAVAA
jgi:glycosyltransferase involved in cell wall biosynthesis